MAGKKHKRGRPLARPHLSNPQTRQPHPKKRTLQRDYSPPAIYAVAAAVLAGVYILWQLQSPTISYPFDDQKTARKWSVQGRAETQLTPDGLLVKPQDAALLISPRLAPLRQTLNWRNFPYVKLSVTPEAKERRMALAWIPGQDPNQNYQLPFTVPASASEVLLDVRQDVAWERRFGWDRNALSQTPVRRLGVLLQNTVEVREVALLSSLNPLQLSRLLWSQYWAVEPVKVSSINAHYGNEVLGTPLVTTFGIIFAVLFALMLVSRRKKFKVPLLSAMLVCFIAPEMPFVGTLWEQAAASGKVSAWHADRYDEYRSRFNQEFADLDREFLKRVPAGSRVAFPNSKQWLIQGESNWIWFLYYDLYENYKDRERDSTHLDKNTQYVFYYHPAGLAHDEAKNILHRTEGKKKGYKTETLARISEQAKILKLIHD